MGPIQSTLITSSTTTQVTTQRARLLGVNFDRTGNTLGSATLEIRNGTSGSSAVLFKFSGWQVMNSDSMVFPSGNYILCEDGIHATTTDSAGPGAIAGITLIYQK